MAPQSPDADNGRYCDSTADPKQRHSETYARSQDVWPILCRYADGDLCLISKSSFVCSGQGIIAKFHDDYTSRVVLPVTVDVLLQVHVYELRASEHDLPIAGLTRLENSMGMAKQTFLGFANAMDAAFSQHFDRDLHSLATMSVQERRWIGLSCSTSIFSASQI